MKRIQKILFLLLFFAGSSRAVTYPFSIIDTPGFYKLASNVNNQITISSSDVTLDMNGGTVSGGTNGIVINSGLNNVIIKDGVITAVNSDGIQVGAGCTDITLKGIAISQAHVALNCEQVTNAFIRDCDFNQSTTGLQLNTCQNVVLQNCTANANTHAGYDLIASTTCSFLECRAISTGESNADIDLTTVFGFVSANGNGNFFENCIANSTMALSVTGSSSLIAGFALRGDESCTKIVNSESSNTETNVSGFTVPYGILLEGVFDSVQSVTGSLRTPLIVFSVDWSPDGKYIAIGGNSQSGGTTEQLQIFSFDRLSGSVTSITGIELGIIVSVKWSPDGQYITVAGSDMSLGTGDELQIMSFDRASGTVKPFTGIFGSAPATGWAASWSPDERYVAVGGDALSAGTGDDFQVLDFDAKEGTLVALDGALAGTILSVDWSPDGKYIAVSGNLITGGTGNEFQVFSFDRGTDMVTSVTGALMGTIYSVRWSPDGKYLLIAGLDITGGSNQKLQVFSFDRVSGLLEFITGYDLGVEVLFAVAEWSPDGKYIAAGGNGLTDNIFVALQFDQAAQTLTFIDQAIGTSGTIRSVGWSPDGTNIAVGGQTLDGGTGDEFQVVSGIQFPSNNVIKGNTVYCNSGGQCPSGIGISAPSITNMVIGNTAFNNPIPRAANEPIVPSNYQFVTNVFDQLFGEGPAATQNIATAALTPQITVPDIPARIKRTELLLESLIDNLL